jgi:TrmH family RNA methyltransferase
MQIDRAIRDRLIVVLVSTRNPLNIGAAARAMSNFGFHRLRVVNPYEVAFEEARSAVGATALLKAAQRFETVHEAVADCSLVVGTTAARNRKLDHELVELQRGAIAIRKHLRSDRVAVLFGSEKRGLSNDELSYCHWLLQIPTEEEHPSMNLGQAVAVCLYELARGRATIAKGQKPETAKSATLDRLDQLLFDALGCAGYTGNDASALAEQKIRRLVRRLRPGEEDAKLWSGMLRQMLWKMQSKR